MWKRGSNERRKTDSEDEDEESQECDSEENGKGLTILVAKARASYKKDCRKAKWSKLWIRKKQAKPRWAVAAAGSGSMPRVQKQGDDCIFDFDCRNHPWAKIHVSHEVWFCDLVVFCRICGAVNSKKGTMQNQCRGRPSKVKGMSEPNGLNVIRPMTQGRPPRE